MVSVLGHSKGEGVNFQFPLLPVGEVWMFSVTTHFTRYIHSYIFTLYERHPCNNIIKTTYKVMHAKNTYCFPLAQFTKANLIS